MSEPVIHRHTSLSQLPLVNAYLVEMANGVVAVDATLTVSDSRAMRARLEKIGKPLLAVLLTQSHPDHYGGLTELVAGDEVPIIAPRGVHEVIRRDEDAKEAILRPMFGDEWTANPTFPNTAVADNETVTFDGAKFTVIDLGPSESPHDSPWLLGEDRKTVFLGDQIYDHMHCYLADGFYEEWLANIDRLRKELPQDASLHVGHGGPVGPADFDWQVGYINRFVEAVWAANWSDPKEAKAGVIATMKQYLPTEKLQFLMELSVEPLAGKLGLTPAAAA